MPAHQLQYRGYKIKIIRCDRGWRIEAVPPSPREPYLQLFSPSEDVATEEDAITLIREKIDGVLKS
jgi:hypothetical protein